MKIIHYGRSEPAKKALLVGIQYSGSVGLETLEGAHEEVSRLKDLLISRYDYPVEGIVVMIDDNNISPNLVPTKPNLLRQIRRLSARAQDGDHLLFYFSGHSGEIVNKSGTEDDGLDEIIVCVDESKIKDTKLKKMLVKPLPVGARLTAIFDSCNSGTLLDLDHYTCNDVWVPWVNKGQRRSDSVRNTITRRLAMNHGSESIIPFEKPNTRGLVLSRRSATLGTSMSSGNLLQRNWPTSRSLSLKDLFDSDLAIQRLGQQGTASIDGILRDRNMNMVSEGLVSQTSISINTSGLPESINDSTIQSSPVVWHFEDRYRTQSPLNIYPRMCDGFCRDKMIPLDHKLFPYVVSISASQDSQTTWSTKRNSMTLSLIKILEHNPSPTYLELMTLLNHSLHASTMKMHKIAKDTRRKKREIKEDDKRYKLEKDNFQIPQLGSILPLDMSDFFVL